MHTFVSVRIRCDQCQRFHGRSPVIGHDDLRGWEDGHELGLSPRWEATAWSRGPRYVGTASEGSYRVEPRDPRFADLRRDRRAPRGARAIELDCPNCPNAPRVRFARLHRLADEAVALGKRDIYV